MFSTTKTPTQLVCIFSSSLELVDQTVRQAVMFLKEQNSQIKIFGFTLILREALNNAVLHGNKGNIDCWVKFNLTVDGKILKMTVTDQGKGFDWRERLKYQEASPDQISGRGLILIRSYGYNLSFNDSGNRLKLEKVIE